MFIASNYSPWKSTSYRNRCTFVVFVYYWPHNNTWNCLNSNCWKMCVVRVALYEKVMYNFVKSQFMIHHGNIDLSKDPRALCENQDPSYIHPTPVATQFPCEWFSMYFVLIQLKLDCDPPSWPYLMLMQSFESISQCYPSPPLASLLVCCKNGAMCSS